MNVLIVHIDIANKCDTYTELDLRYFLFLFVAPVYFAQEYCGLEVYVFLHKINSCNK